MLVGNQNITKENMPSYVSPQQQPYHTYQLMQDQLNMGLTVMQQPMQPQQGMQNPASKEIRNNQWDNKQ